MDSEKIVELYAIIKGTVQGVGFRATTQHYAEEQNLIGAVKNLPDGSVEVYAQGVQKNLDDFVKALKNHQGLGVVKDVITEYSSPSRNFSSFDIIF